jgi:hypothetical protein
LVSALDFYPRKLYGETNKFPISYSFFFVVTGTKNVGCALWRKAKLELYRVEKVTILLSLFQGRWGPEFYESPWFSK